MVLLIAMYPNTYEAVSVRDWYKLRHTIVELYLLLTCVESLTMGVKYLIFPRGSIPTVLRWYLLKTIHRLDCKRKADNSHNPITAKDANEDVMGVPLYQEHIPLPKTHKVTCTTVRPQRHFNQSNNITYDDHREKDVSAHWQKIKLWFWKAVANRREAHQGKFVLRKTYASSGK